MQTILTWWIRAASFVATISAAIMVIANIFCVDAASIVTTEFVSLTCYKATVYQRPTNVLLLRLRITYCQRNYLHCFKDDLQAWVHFR